jgi:L-asparagine transporter-like permease
MSKSYQPQRSDDMSRTYPIRHIIIVGVIAASGTALFLGNGLHTVCS